MQKNPIVTEIELSMPCYYCGAFPKSPCLTLTGRKCEPHSARFNEAVRQGLLPIAYVK